MTKEKFSDYIRKQGDEFRKAGDGYEALSDTSKACIDYAVQRFVDEYAKQREQYWKARCLAAEDYISATPCDPDITNEQILSGEKWQSLKDQENQFIEQQNKE